MSAIFICLEATLFSLTVCASGQCACGDGQDGLRLSISTGKHHLSQGEPLVLDIEVKNVSEQRQILKSPLTPESGHLTFKIVGPKGRLHKFQPYVLYSGEVGMQDLAPKSSVKGRQVLFYSPNWGFHFDQPGDYTVQAIHRLHELESNVLKIRVRPAGRADQKALEHIRGNPQAMFALGATADPIIGREFETVVRKYPESTYVP
jgi:hypothetical protein